MSGVFIPDQLEQMSKKELLEFAQTAHEENVKLNAELKRESMELRSRLGAALGRNSEYNEAIENMQQKLAKANERVAILEKERDLAQGMYNSLLGDLSAGYGKLRISECEKHLNKFAIEQQIKALEFILGRVEPVTVSNAVKAHIAGRIEQLRKEQDYE